MYGFVLAPDCTIHFINVLNTERAKRARKKYVVPFKCQMDWHKHSLCCLVSDCKMDYNYGLSYKAPR